MASLIDTLTTKFNFVIDNSGLSGLRSSLDGAVLGTNKLSVGAAEAEIATQKAGLASEFFANKLKELRGVLFGFFGAFIGFEAIEKSVEAFNNMQQAMAQIKAGLQSTGNAVGYTSDQLEGMAGQLEKTSTYDKADILKNLTAQLLQFTNVSGQAFTRAQQDILDYSARTGRSLSESATVIGRALNNPAQSLGMLTRVGIQFSDSQKKAIDAMVKGGNAAGAQSEILDLLETKFKGSAEAAAEAGTGPLKQFINRIIDLSEAIGNLIVNVLNPFLIALNKTIDWIQDNATFVKIFIGVLATLTTAIYSVRIATAAWAAVTTVLDAVLSPLYLGIAAFVAIAAGLAIVIQDLIVFVEGGNSAFGRWLVTMGYSQAQIATVRKGLVDLGKVFTFIGKIIVDILEGDLDAAKEFFKFMIDSIELTVKGFEKLGSIGSKIGGKIKSLFGGGSNPTGVSGALIGGSNSKVSNVTTTHAPVSHNINLTVNAGSENSAEKIGNLIMNKLGLHFRNTAIANDNGIAS